MLPMDQCSSLETRSSRNRYHTECWPQHALLSAALPYSVSIHSMAPWSSSRDSRAVEHSLGHSSMSYTSYCSKLYWLGFQIQVPTWYVYFTRTKTSMDSSSCMFVYCQKTIKETIQVVAMTMRCYGRREGGKQIRFHRMDVMCFQSETKL